MAINLQKGQTIDLRKNDKGDSFDLSQVTIGLGWDVRKKKGGFLSGLLGGGKEEEYDLDAIAFLLDANGKVANLGRKAKGAPWFRRESSANGAGGDQHQSSATGGSEVHVMKPDN